jgi:hypothetical protein
MKSSIEKQYYPKIKYSFQKENKNLFHTMDKKLDMLFVRNRETASDKLFGRKSIDLNK